MLTRRSLVLAFAALAALPLGPALAYDTQPYTPEALKVAQASGKPLLVEIHAPWCPTCKAQDKVLDVLLKDPRYKDLQILRIDFDSQKADVAALGARSQSTIIVYRGAEERGRMVGETSTEAIDGLLGRAL